jgi:tetratricopeptide (TPR) repeat protein
MSEARLLLERAQAAPLGDPGQFHEALLAAQKAEELTRTAEVSEDTRRRAAALVATVGHEENAARRDRRLLAALLEARGPREGPKFQQDDRGFMVALAAPSPDEQFRAAWREWDPTFDVDALPTEKAAARLRRRPAGVVTEVIAALDAGAAQRRWQGLPREKWQPLVDLAGALDDPRSGRRELRDLLARDNLRRERGLGALAMALRPVPIPFDAGLGEDRTRLRQLAEVTDAASEPVLGLLTLVAALWEAGDEAGAERLLRDALRARPQEVVLHAGLGAVLTVQQPPRWDAAVASYAAARALRPELGERLAHALVHSGQTVEGFALFDRLVIEQRNNPWLHHQRGYALAEHGRYKEAEAAFLEAIDLQPDYPQAHYDLGAALYCQAQYEGAEAAFGEAIRRKPDDPQARYGLGLALFRQGRYKEAEAACRKAIHLQGDAPESHYILGAALYYQSQYKEAEAAFLDAIRLQHDYPQAHTGLGAALYRQGQDEEAEAACREAIRLRTDLPEAHYNLGNALYGQGRYEEAEAAYREAIRLQHDYPQAHTGLGNALYGQDRYEEAEAAFRDAIRLQHDDPESHCGLGFALCRQGQFTKALESLRLGHALGMKPPGWNQPSADWIRDCEHLLELDSKLPAVLHGTAEPACPSERLEFAVLCQHYKRLPVTATRLYGGAFADDPKLAEDLRQQPRYGAACAAARAAAGQGDDARWLPDKVALMLRRQALGWLRADLALYEQLAEREEPAAKQAVRERMRHWQQEAGLASVRDPAALNRLSDDERAAWRRLWANVTELRQKVEPTR